MSTFRTNDANVALPPGRSRRHQRPADLSVPSRIRPRPPDTRPVSLEAMRTTRVNLSIAIAIASVAAPGLGSAQSPSRSVGRTDRGRLIGGAALADEGEDWTLEGRRARYGTVELVALLSAAIRHTHGLRADTPRLVIGDLSRRRGGALAPHLSHRSGRDADVGYYYLGADGRPLAARTFIRVDQSGQCVRRGGAPCRLDVARTWDLIAAMLPPSTPVQYMMIAPHIRELLLQEAERRGASDELVLRFRLVSARMGQSAEHDDHFHVRVYCAADDHPGCIDESPFHEWHAFSADADPAFVARARERASGRRRQEIAGEAADRERRARAGTPGGRRDVATRVQGRPSRPASAGPRARQGEACGRGAGAGGATGGGSRSGRAARGSPRRGGGRERGAKSARQREAAPTARAPSRRPVDVARGAAGLQPRAHGAGPGRRAGSPPGAPRRHRAGPSGARGRHRARPSRAGGASASGSRGRSPSGGAGRRAAGGLPRASRPA